MPVQGRVCVCVGGGGGDRTWNCRTDTYIKFFVLSGEFKGRFTRYNFVACDMLTTSLGLELFRVNQTYNMLAIVVYDTKNVVGF